MWRGGSGSQMFALHSGAVKWSITKRVALVRSLYSCSDSVWRMSLYWALISGEKESPSPTIASGMRPKAMSFSAAPSQQQTKEASESIFNGSGEVGKSPSARTTTFCIFDV